MKNPSIKFNYEAMVTEIRSALGVAYKEKGQLEKSAGYDPFNFGGKTFFDVCTESQRWEMHKIQSIIEALEKADKAAGELMNALFVASTTAPSPE